MAATFRSILCPTDLSPTGDRAVAIAYALASPKATVHLLHLWEPAYVLSPLDAPAASIAPTAATAADAADAHDSAAPAETTDPHDPHDPEEVTR